MLLTSLQAVWRGVRAWSRRVLEKASEKVLDVQGVDDRDDEDDDDDDDEREDINSRTAEHNRDEQTSGNHDAS